MAERRWFLAKLALVAATVCLATGCSDASGGNTDGDNSGGDNAAGGSSGCGSLEAAGTEHFADAGFMIPEGGCLHESAVYYFSSDDCETFGTGLAASLGEAGFYPVGGEPGDVIASEASGDFNLTNGDVQVITQCAVAGPNFWSDLGINVAETDTVASITAI